MYNLILQARPQKEHKHYNTYGDTFINCWLNSNTKNSALITLENYLADNDLELVELIESHKIHYSQIIKNREKLKLYNTALSTNELYQLHQSPKYSTILANYNVEKIDVKVLIKLEVWMDVDYLTNKIDPFQPDFWKGQDLEKTLLKKVIMLTKPEGFKVIKLNSINVIESTSLNDKQKLYQDDVEEYGYSLIFKKFNE